MIVGNRGFFPGHLCESGRETILKVLAEEGIPAIALTTEDTKFGSVESVNDAHKCADLFKEHRDEIDGVLVTLPNFGDERAIANTLRWAELDVPVLVHAFPDDALKMTIADRRDSFCGKMSACNNLNQYSIKFSLTGLHTVDPESESFRADLERLRRSRARDRRECPSNFAGSSSTWSSWLAAPRSRSPSRGRSARERDEPSGTSHGSAASPAREK